MEDVCKKINKKLPCRNKIISELFDLIGDSKESFPNAIYLYGQTGTGKTAIISELLENSESKFVIINCIECYTSRILYETILNSFCKKNDSLITKCDNLKDFILNLRTLLKTSKSYILCLDSAERVRDMDANILPSFLRLQELTGLNVCCVMLSELPFEKFYPKTGLSQVINVHCPQYNKNEIHEILFQDFEYLKNYIKSKLVSSSSENDQNEIKINILSELESDFYKNFLNLFLTVCYRVCRDLPELRIMSHNCFEIYCTPVLNGTIDRNDVAKLWRHISLPLKTAIAKVYMRIDSNFEDKINVDNFLETNQCTKRLAQSLELPFYAKYLLIASFLASHNSPKDDRRLFVKNCGKVKKRMQTVNANVKVQDKMSTSLGPKSFTIDRLLAIFYAILDEKVGLTCNLLSQISTLVHLKFLTFLSGENNIIEGSARLQCTVGLEFIVNIGKIVGFNVRQYLCDFM